jgi:hypothetical protein
MTPKQRLWADIFRCAVLRSNEYLDVGDLDRHAREHTTAILALQKGDKFWKEYL